MVHQAGWAVCLPTESWLLFGTLSATLWGRSGLLLQALTSRLQGNPSSIMSMLCYCFWRNVCEFQINLMKPCRIVAGRLAPCVHHFSSPSSPFCPSSPSFSSFCLLARLLAGAGERSEAERGRCVSSFVVGYHLGVCL